MFWKSRDRGGRPGPTFKDWLLLSINIVFVAMGLVIVRDDFNVGIVTIAFFGSCLAVAANAVVSKLRFRTFTATRVDVVGGVPIRPLRWKMQLLGLWLLGLGVVLVVFGENYPPMFRALAGVIGLAGAALLIATLTRQWPAGFLQFDPDALTIAGRNWRARIPWGRISLVAEGDYHSNPVLFIGVDDITAIDIGSPPGADAALKAMARSRMMMGSEFAIMTSQYGIDLPVLAETVRGYAEDPVARVRLRPRPRL